MSHLGLDGRFGEGAVLICVRFVCCVLCVFVVPTHDLGVGLGGFSDSGRLLSCNRSW